MKQKKNIKIDETNIDLETVVNNCVYSSKEKIVGEWFGKPLYSKTFYVSALSNTAGGTNYNHNIANVDKIWLDLSSSFLDKGGYEFSPLCFIHPELIANGFSINQYGSITVDGLTSTNFRINVGQDRSDWSAYITLKYTKTTD